MKNRIAVALLVAGAGGCEANRTMTAPSPLVNVSVRGQIQMSGAAGDGLSDRAGEDGAERRGRNYKRTGRPFFEDVTEAGADDAAEADR